MIDEVDRIDPVGSSIITWRSRPRNPFHGELWQGNGRYYFWGSDVGWYEIDPKIPRITCTRAQEPLKREVRIWGVPVAVALTLQGDLSLHGAAVEIDGAAVMLAGPGHHGKTTLSAAFARAGHRVLSEDSARCRLGRPPLLFPGPAVIRLRPDVADGLRPPDAELALEDADRRYYVLAPHVRGTADPIPLAAILLLNEVDVPPRLLPMAPERALRDLWTVAFRLPTDLSRRRMFDDLASLISVVPVFELQRPFSLESLDEVVQVIQDRARAGW